MDLQVGQADTGTAKPQPYRSKVKIEVTKVKAGKISEDRSLP